MKILAFDSTGPILSVGAASGGQPVARLDALVFRGQGSLLDRQIDLLLSGVGWPRSDVEGLALLTGPGSLTAMRIGWATATGWSQAAGIPIIGWTVPQVHARTLSGEASGAVCAIHYRANTFLLYDLARPDAPPAVIELNADSRSQRSPRQLTGPGILDRRAEWTAYCGPETEIVADSKAIVGADTLALWGEADLLQGKSLPLDMSPLDYGIPPDFKKITPA